MTPPAQFLPQPEDAPLRTVIARLWAQGDDSAVIARIVGLPEAEIERIRVALRGERARPVRTVRRPER